MEDDNRRNDLPDISSVFQVDESDIPAGLISKPREPQRRVSSYRSDAVLSRPQEDSGSRRAAASEENRRGYAARQRAEYEDEQRRARAARQREEAYARQGDFIEEDFDEAPDAYAQPLRRQAQRSEAQRAYRATRHNDVYAESRGEAPRRENARRDTQRRQAPRAERLSDSREEAMRREQRKRAIQKKKTMRMLSGILIPVLIFAAVLAVVLAVKAGRTPKVVVAEAKDASVEDYTEFAAIAVQDPSGTGESHVYAVFVANNYADLGIADGNKVNLVLADGRVVPGGVAQIIQKDATDPLLERIGAALPQTLVSPEENHVVVVLPDDSSACADGDIVSAQVVTQTSANVLTVPVTALRTDGATIYVWVYAEKGLSKKIERRDVSVGMVSAERAEITGGLKSGEKVVVGSNRMPIELINGMRVRLEEAPVEITAAPAEG